MATPQVTPWPLEPGLLSEGPRWDEERQELLWVDILGRGFHRATLTLDGRPDQVRTMALDRHVGAVAPVAGGGYVLAAGQGFLFAGEDGSVRELVQPEADRPEVRMNDGACDPQGRFWAGTMAYDESPGAGTLYRLELDGSCSTALTGLTISNGIGGARTDPLCTSATAAPAWSRRSTSTARRVRSAAAGRSCRSIDPGWRRTA